MPETASRSRLGKLLPLLLLFGLAAVEVLGHFVARCRVPADEEYRRAAARIERERAPRDAVTTAPSWAEPMFRAQLLAPRGLADVGMSDLARFERLWVVSIRGHEPPRSFHLPDGLPALDERFGEVRLRRYDLGPSSVRYDFVDALAGAEVTMGEGERARPCPRGVGDGIPGGLGGGPMPPRERFVCGGPRHWVGETVVETLDLEPRRCVYQHPSPAEPVTVAFDGVPLGERLVVYTGLDYHDERDLEGEPYTLAISIDGRPLRAITHRDGEGWKRVEVPIALPEGGGRVGELEFRVTSASRQRRSVCWAATMRGPARPHAE